MNILVTGSKGQLGSELQQLPSPDNLNLIFTDVDELNICDIDTLRKYAAANQPEVIVNCAAYTSVDKAESEIEAARAVNVNAVDNLIKVCKETGASLIHVSTDFVFSGEKSSPYLESDEPGPLSVYGKTKAEGEELIVKSGISFSILRTSWLYSFYGSNFVKTILRLARERGELKVVDDQTGTPTYARDLAGVIMLLLDRRKAGEKEIYHFSNEGTAAWYDLAKAVVDLSGIECDVKPVPSTEFPTDAVRPNYSVMSKAKIKSALDIEIPYWRDSLKHCLVRLAENENR